MNISGINTSTRSRADLLSGASVLKLDGPPDNCADAKENLKLVTTAQVSLSVPRFASDSLPTAQDAQWSALSLFCGGGGLDLGFLAEGISPTAAYDNSKAAVKVYSENFGSPVRCANLSNYMPRERCDVLLAGAPCQGFSTAGRRALLDPRNQLLGRVADICVELRPRVVIVENVPAALSGGHRRLWVELEDRIRLAGYNVARLQLQGEESGIPQRRRRLFLVGWLGSDCLRMELPKISELGLRETLVNVGNLSGHNPKLLDEDDRRSLIADAIPPGGKLSNVRRGDRAIATWEIPKAFGMTTPDERELLLMVSKLRRRNRKRDFGDGDPVELTVLARNLGREIGADVAGLIERGFLRDIEGCIELKHTYNGKFRRLCWDELSPTVDTRFGRPELFLHPDQNRGMTLREAARIQGFSDDYSLPSNVKEGFDVIGNAVPPPMSARLAWFVREALLKSA